MPNFIFANNVNTTLAGPVSSSATSFTLSSTANLPASIPSGSVLVITLNDVATKQNFEVIYVGTITGATCSNLSRGQEGTGVLSWLTNDFAYSPPTAGQQRSFGQLGESQTWSGANTFTDPVAVGAATNPADAIQLGQATGRLLNVQTFLASAPYTPSSSLVTRVVAKIKGAGGGSASAPSTGSNSVSVGGPGGEGAYCETLLTTGFSGTEVFVGVGGSGGLGGGGGNGGGSSSLGSAIAGGGFGGVVGPASTLSAAAAAAGIATASGGNILNEAGSGSALSSAFALGGQGIGIPGQGGGGTQEASAGIKYGSGGGGVANGFSSGVQAGFAGANGYVEIWEYS